uniref:Thioredoxin domain-containing protein n=1 Tax=Zonotrichia albicollis TaxID=44394 RepID=A0A8D2NBB4_ZONAL
WLSGANCCLGTGWVSIRGQWEIENHVLLLKKSNFDRALKETKYLLVKFYAPWSHECRKLLPVWDKLGEQFESHKDIMIAKIDVTANDILAVALDRYPFFTLFPAGAHHQEVAYTGEYTLEAFSEFLEEQRKMRAEAGEEPGRFPAMRHP